MDISDILRPEDEGDYVAVHQAHPFTADTVSMPMMGVYASDASSTSTQNVPTSNLKRPFSQPKRHLPCTQTSAAAATMSSPDQEILPLNAPTASTIPAHTPRLSFFSSSKTKKQKTSDVRSDIASLIEAKKSIQEKQIGINEVKDKRDAQMHEFMVVEQIKKEARASEIHELIVEKYKNEESRAREAHNIMMEEKRVDIRIKEAQLRLLDNQM